MPNLTVQNPSKPWVVAGLDFTAMKGTGGGTASKRTNMDLPSVLQPTISWAEDLGWLNHP